MKIKTFEDLFNILIEDAYFIEQNSIKIFPKMIEKTDSDDLKNALRKHQAETKEHMRRLEKIFELKKQEYPTKTQENPLANFFTFTENFLTENNASALLDAAIIAFQQQIEHLEIATYGTLKEYARQLGEAQITDILNETLKEEEKTDTALNNLAKGGFFKEGINVRAINELVS